MAISSGVLSDFGADARALCKRALLNPPLSMLAFIYLVALEAIVLGVFLVMLGYKVRQTASRSSTRSRPGQSSSACWRCSSRSR